MTAIAALLSDRDRERLAGRLAEWRDTDSEMRRPGSLAAPPEPVPLHRARTQQDILRQRVIEAKPGTGGAP